jgi:hypothetical protein
MRDKNLFLLAFGGFVRTNRLVESKLKALTRFG